MSRLDNKTLLEYSIHTPCQDIFQAVCDKIGRHYENSGFKYYSSGPKIVFKDEDLKVEICFGSSRSNIPGKYVNLEILPNFYSNEIIKIKKSKGFLFGHTGLFVHKFNDNPKQIKVRQIFGDETERIDEYSNESVITDNNNCNVYGLDEGKFDLIINFIDKKIISWISNLKTEEGILALTENPCRTRIWALNGKGGKSDFIEYVELKFPNIDIEKRLGN
jgi:hypothetical protein